MNYDEPSAVVIERTSSCKYCDVCSVRTILQVLGTLWVCGRCMPISSLVTGPPYHLWDLPPWETILAEYGWWERWCHPGRLSTLDALEYWDTYHDPCN